MLPDVQQSYECSSSNMRSTRPISKVKASANLPGHTEGASALGRVRVACQTCRKRYTCTFLSPFCSSPLVVLANVAYCLFQLHIGRFGYMELVQGLPDQTCTNRSPSPHPVRRKQSLYELRSPRKERLRLRARFAVRLLATVIRDEMLT
jgi:hypothetical protein